MLSAAPRRSRATCIRWIAEIINREVHPLLRAYSAGAEFLDSPSEERSMNPEETKSSYYEQFISRPYALFFLVSGLLVLIVLAVLFALRRPTHALTTAKC